MGREKKTLLSFGFDCHRDGGSCWLDLRPLYLLFSTTVYTTNYQYIKRLILKSGPMSMPATPRSKAPLNPTTPAAGRVTGSHVVQASPHYATTRRHSLYGTEDRVVIDPGSRIWKVGFSGEGRPRDVFCAGAVSGQSLWSLNRATDAIEREEDDRLLQVQLELFLRSVFHECVSPFSSARYNVDTNSSAHC